jgi:hypothetical protein
MGTVARGLRLGRTIRSAVRVAPPVGRQDRGCQALGDACGDLWHGRQTAKDRTNVNISRAFVSSFGVSNKAVIDIGKMEFCVPS